MPGTRVALDDDEATPPNVDLTWQTGDKIFLVYTTSDGVFKGTQEVIVGEADNGKKSISFTLTIPAETGSPFKLYGVYGATAIDGNGIVTLPNASTWSASLSDLGGKDVPLLKFYEEVSGDFSITFEHVGSLFHIELKNSTTSDYSNVTKAELYSASDIQAVQYGGAATYDPVGNTFGGTSSATGHSLPFTITATTLQKSNGNTLDFWGWFAPATGNWPWLGLRITYNDGEEKTISSCNFKEKRDAATATGKAYHFYASLIPENGTQYLKFTNSGGNPVVNTFTDSDTNRDPDGYGTAGSYTYKLVLIGDQIWMAENLKYLPAIHFRYNGSDTEARYYVFGYPEYGDPTLSGAMEATTNYTTYGVLYNWPAAMNGETSSWFNPSGVQGICPNGWHLPSMLEWNTLRDHLGGASVAGNKMKETGTTHWTDTNTGATNESGFTALPGGFLDDHDFVDIGDYGYWWSSLESDYYALFLGLSYDGDFGWLSDYKNYGCSVRCVRD